MENLFFQFVLQPIIDFLVSEAKKTEATPGAVAEIETKVMTALVSFLEHFTHATTKPSDFITTHIEDIKSMIAKAIEGKQQT